VIVGFIGLGNMGGAMAANLLAKRAAPGFALAVWNRSREKCAPLAALGARVAATPAELARDVDVVLACLADVATTRRVLLGDGDGDGGVLGAARRGMVVVDHGTVDLATTRDCHDAFARAGASFLDAPISGGPEGARAATLAIMVGGDAAAFERARPLFDAMGRTVLRMGESGAGTATKLANQLLVGVHSLAACEALTMARRAGVELPKLLEVLRNAWGQSRMLERNFPAIAGEDYDRPGAPLRNLVKDLAIIGALGDELGLRLDGASAALDVYRELAERGEGTADIAAACRIVDPHRASGHVRS